LGKFYARVKNLGRFTNKTYFFKFPKRANFFTPAQNFPKIIVDNIDPKDRFYQRLKISPKFGRERACTFVFIKLLLLNCYVSGALASLSEIFTFIKIGETFNLLFWCQN